MTSTVPPLDLARIRRYADARVPATARHQVRLEVEVGRDTVTLVERRAPWKRDLGTDWSRQPIVRLRYSEADEGWTLFWSDRDGAWHRDSKRAPVRHVGRCWRRSSGTREACSGADRPAPRGELPPTPVTTIRS